MHRGLRGARKSLDLQEDLVVESGHNGIPPLTVATVLDHCPAA